MPKSLDVEVWQATWPSDKVHHSTLYVAALCMHASATPQVNKFARNAATTFAPRASGATKNPAYKGMHECHLQLCMHLMREWQAFRMYATQEACSTPS